MRKLKPKIIKNFILDVDGVMTDGKFYYSKEGKILKCFGADDNDALNILKPYLNIQFVSGDKKGFSITKKRISDDMKFPLELVSTIKRIDWIKKNFDTKSTIYMGDGIFDYLVMRDVGYSIATKNADENCKKYANFVTKRIGSDRAVAEACIHIANKFFKKVNPYIPLSNSTMSGGWQS
tara:strand:+ start:73 stop:609 length:537 start_codon:yes stop_codon:yes gene_type:complete